MHENEYDTELEIISNVHNLKLPPISIIGIKNSTNDAK